MFTNSPLMIVAIKFDLRYNCHSIRLHHSVFVIFTTLPSILLSPHLNSLTIIHLFIVIICVTCLHLVSVHLYQYLVLSVCSVRVG